MEKLSFQEWADILKSFYEDNSPEYKEATIEHIKNTVLESPMAEETFIDEDQALEIAQQVHKIWENEEEQEEQTSFNNPELFVKEYKDYLIGKKIFIGRNNQVQQTIENVDTGEIEGENIVAITDNDTVWFLHPDSFKDFIDGNEVSDFYGKEKIDLILQEEKTKENLFNKPEYKYYVINSNGIILGGFEYKEDAKVFFDNKILYGDADSQIVSKKDLDDDKINVQKINPNDNSHWSLNEHDWNIIEKCILAGSEANEYSPKEAQKYIEGFKKDGSYIAVVKARLIYCLANAQQKLRGAYIVSNLESINEKCDENCRIQKELKRVIAMEK